MSTSKKLLKQTAIYGLATVLPRVFSFILVPLYTKILPKEEYGEISIIFSWMVLFNVVLAYGMETSFFRFFHSDKDSNQVFNTSILSVFWTSISFLIAALLFRNTLASLLDIDVTYITYTIWILVLDALVIIPFSKLRAEQKPLFYTIIKICNVAVNLGLNVFLLVYLADLATENPDSFWASIYVENFEIGYVFISNLIASGLTFLVLSNHYYGLTWKINFALWKKMMRYGWPILVAGIAFSINETFDRILLDHLLPPETAKAQIGAYSACYKLALFMTLFATAFRLGIEPFFFSHAKNKNAPQTYALITQYFVIFGSLILIVVVVFADLLKLIMIQDASYHEAMNVVPLIIMANLFLGIYHNLSVWYKLTDKTKMGAYISIVGAMVTLALNFLLIEKISYLGSAIATVSAYGIMMLISYRLGSKYYPIPYNKTKIFGYLSVSVVGSLIHFYFFRENYVIGVLFLLIFSFFVYRNEKQTLLALLKR
uniref:oligosaccharide flippase family protein n=1 Tax=Flavobacterium sp. TaxID=239 RepID=UPI004049A902